VPVMPVNCLEIDEGEIKEILTQVLFEFPVKEVSVGLPGWAMTLGREHWLRSGLCGAVSEAAKNLRTLRDVKHLAEDICSCEYVTGAKIAKMDLSCGAARIEAQIDGSLFYKILAEETGLDISDEQDLMSCMRELAAVRRRARGHHARCARPDDDDVERLFFFQLFHTGAKIGKSKLKIKN